MPRVVIEVSEAQQKIIRQMARKAGGVKKLILEALKIIPAPIPTDKME